MKHVETQPVSGQTAASRYEQLVPVREPYLQRARRAAALTIPSLMPPLGSNGSTNLPTPFQSIGAQGVKTVTSKILLALFPPGGSFFRFGIDDFVLDQLKQQAGDGYEDARAEFDTALAKVERSITNRLEQVGSRTQLSEHLQNLAVCGNGLLQVLKGARLKFFPLSQYVVKRDLEGNVLEVITKESLAKAALPEEARALVESEQQDGETKDGKSDSEDSVELYTVCRRDGTMWDVYQELCGKVVPGSEGSYPIEKSAMIVGRWNAISGEDYGRGLVEEHFGDLESAERLSQSIVEFSAIAAKIVFFVKEGNLTSKAAIQRARSGDILDGDAKDVTTLMLEKYADFQVAKATLDEIVPRLKAAFLMNTSIQRNAERVTAEEIRYMAQELEQVLGGVYSVQAQELQLPIVKRVMFVMQRERTLPFLPEKAVSPQIVTGLDGLGRSSDLNKLELLLSGSVTTFGPEVTAEYFNLGGYFKRKAAALGIDTDGLVRTDQQVQQERAAKAQQQTTQAIAPHLVGAAVKGAEMQNQANAKPQQ